MTNGEIGIEEVVVDILDEDELLILKQLNRLKTRKQYNNCINEFARHYNKKSILGQLS